MLTSGCGKAIVTENSVDCIDRSLSEMSDFILALFESLPARLPLRQFEVHFIMSSVMLWISIFDSVIAAL